VKLKKDNHLKSLNIKWQQLFQKLEYYSFITFKIVILFVFLITPLYCTAQQDQIKTNGFDSLKMKPDTSVIPFSSKKNTIITGKIIDATTGQPLSFINISIPGTTFGTSSDKDGKFTLTASGLHSHITFSYVSYQTITRTIKPGQDNTLEIRLHTRQQQLKEVVVRSSKKQRYRNKGNPAVELIQQVINHKEQNRMQSSNYLQYDQYERIVMSFFNLSQHFLNQGFFSKYKFMIDTTQVIEGRQQPTFPLLVSEKTSQNYYRKEPEKSIQIITGKKEINILKFIDTTGLNIYLNRMYGDNIDLYENNIFILTNQFLSPIANHSPDFYKFFITDTITVGSEKLIELSYTPRNKGDLLFEGKLLVTMDGHYAVKSCELNLNQHININFVRSFNTTLDFEHNQDGRYYLSKSDVKADFGITKGKGTSIFGERTVILSNYKLNSPQPDLFYKGKSVQEQLSQSQQDTDFWKRKRGDTLNKQVEQVYAKINKIETIPSFKRRAWIVSTLTGGFADFGPFQFGPVGDLYSFNNVEGSRFWLGGRTTPKLSKSVFFEGYTAYGTKDNQLKYELNTYIALNKVAYYHYPSDYFKIGYQYDVGVPGELFPVDNNYSNTLLSFQRGVSNYYIYGRTFTASYVKDFQNHFSYSIGFKNWDQQAADALVYENNDPANTFVHNLTTSEIDLNLRYAPHEKIIEGTIYRYTIYSKYPIFTLNINKGIKGLLNGSYNYTRIDANIIKRIYMSQLGYGDITILGGMIAGKLPFPLLNIPQANQTYSYDPDAYSQMNYLEFVTDHYAGIHYTQSFSGFFLNKIPLIDRLNWREFLSAKILYGGLRAENNPALSKGLYDFPASENGNNGTFALGNTPYIEGGVGIGNIFKVFRFDLIRRFTYLNHPGVAPYGIKFTITPDF
jgi:hypothetical protein